MACKEHDFHFRVGVAHFEDKPGNGMLELSARCKVCGVNMVFYGPRGAGGSVPMASVDRLELRCPITFGYEPKFDPPPTMMINGPEIVPLGQKPDA